MDAQRKKGILDVCVLAVLKKGPSYGYMIIRDLSRCIEISESTVYPILKRLEQNGSLRTYRQEHNGRMRKYYELTQTGQRRIDVFLEEWDELHTMYRFIEEENRREGTLRQEAADENAASGQAGHVLGEEGRRIVWTTESDTGGGGTADLHGNRAKENRTSEESGILDQAEGSWAGEEAGALNRAEDGLEPEESQKEEDGADGLSGETGMADRGGEPTGDLPKGEE